MTFKEFFLLETSTIKSLDGKREGNILLWREWLKELQKPGYSGTINFPGQSVELPRSDNIEDLYKVIERNLKARGYDTSTYRGIKPKLSYYGWEDPDALVNEPDYDPDIHMQRSAFDQAAKLHLQQADDIISEPIDPADNWKQPETILKKNDRIQLVKDLHTDPQWINHPTYRLPRIGTHGVVIGVRVEDDGSESPLIVFKGFKNSPIAMDSSYVKKIGLNSFE